MTVENPVAAERKRKKLLSTQRTLKFGEKMAIVRQRGLLGVGDPRHSYSEISKKLLIKRCTVISVCMLYVKNGKFEMKKQSGRKRKFEQWQIKEILGQDQLV